MDKRNESIDVLRWVALTGIILVHSEPSFFWTQLRSFDVPLMVIMSALCFANSKGVVNKQEYYFKRFVRLVIPAWIFLTGYFLLSYLFDGNIDIKKLVMCYTLTTSWYFWIIRILVAMAFLAPFLLFTRELPIRTVLYICIILICISEALSFVSDYYYYTILIMFIPYTAYYLLGINLNRFSEKSILKFGLISLSLFVIYAAILYSRNEKFVLTGEYKYPPRFYYTCYALGFSAILWHFKDTIVRCLKKTKMIKFALFVGSHTYWVYLWHIPFIDSMAGKYHIIIYFVIAYFSAILLTYLQSRIVQIVCGSLRNDYISKNIKMIFVG